MPKFIILNHIPPYGATPQAFGWTDPREGFVVEFIPENKPTWVGNFKPGIGGINDVVEHLNGKYLIVIAKGDGYIVDPETRDLVLTFSWGIDYYVLVPELNEIVFGNLCYFLAIGTAGLLWTTRDIAWGDGIRAITRTKTSLSGESYNPMDDSWIPFSIDLADGSAKGGSSFNHPNRYD
jgi:hypothetical protein